MTMIRPTNPNAIEELEHGVNEALRTYSNVHRGSGHFSEVTTYLYEKARQIVLKYMNLENSGRRVIFCTPSRAEVLCNLIRPGSFRCISSADLGLSLGVIAVAAEKRSLPAGAPFQTGGGSARLISPKWVIWAEAPERFEAGTPAIINIIAFARALLLAGRYGSNVFKDSSGKLTAEEILYHDELEKYSGPELLTILRKTMTGRDVQVPVAEGSTTYINLDNGASTPAFQPALKAFYQSLNLPLQVRSDIIKEVKSVLAGMLDAPQADFDVIFTSNTTEAINLASKSFSVNDENEMVIVNTLLEHSSNELPWRMIPNSDLIRMPVSPEGFLNLEELESLLRDYNQDSLHGKKRIRLVAVSGASNVLGTCNDLAAIGNIVHRYGAFLLADAAQLLAHRKMSMKQCGIDFLAFSAHKAYAPFGTGALVARKGLIHIDSLELDKITLSGSENIAGIAALGKALILLKRTGFEIIQEEERSLTAHALNGMARIKGLKVYGIKDPSAPEFARKGGVIVFSIDGLFANVVAQELAEHGGIGVRYGCHCAHMLVKYLLNVPPALAQFQGLIVSLFHGIRLPGVVRISIGIENTAEDLDTLLRMLEKIALKSFRKSKTDIKKRMNDFVLAASDKVYQ